MNKYKIILFILLQLFGLQNLFAQNDSELFVAVLGEFPAMNFNNSKLVSQQNNVAIGYAFTNNVELQFNLGLGILGVDDGENSFVNQFTNAGLSVAYLFQINKKYKLGPEICATYAISDVVNDINYDHAIYQAGIKMQENWMLGSIGMRYRSFFDYSFYNNWEFYTGIGVRLAWFSKSK